MLPEKEEIIFHILHYIATGIFSILQDKRESIYPYDEVVQQGLNGLAALSLEKGVEPPCSPIELIAWCKRPLRDWGIFPKESLWALDDSIVQKESLCLSDLGNELVIISKDLSQQIEQKLMKDVLMECRIKDDQKGYVEFRTFLIEHPYLTREMQESINFTLDQEHLMEPLARSYESLSAATLRNEKGEAMSCGYCGWIVEESRNGQLFCINEYCKEKTRGFTNSKPIQDKANNNLLRLKRGLMRYIAYPGKYELKLYEELKKFNSLQVELWPKIDTYDLCLTFKDGEVWVVDVKDWQNPCLLAIKSQPFSREYNWETAFFVIPNYRTRDCKRYLNIFENQWKTRKKDDYEGVEFKTYSNFIKRVQEKCKGIL